MQTLTCEAGHQWERQQSRGRPPMACPEHRSAASEQAAVRHRTFYVAHPLPPSPPRATQAPKTAEERAESARRASLARWSASTPEERSEAARRAAVARHEQAGHRTREPVVEVQCQYCGVIIRGAKRKQCGAPECLRQFNAERCRRAMHERRARMMGTGWETFDPREVYERDGWTCGICGLPVDPSLASPDAGSVSLDHITPVSLGGAHTRENTRCSHLGCNRQRGNRVT